jgi:hypothetical protein
LELELKLELELELELVRGKGRCGPCSEGREVDVLREKADDGAV